MGNAKIVRPVEWQCEHCARWWNPSATNFRCKSCGAFIPRRALEGLFGAMEFSLLDVPDLERPSLPPRGWRPAELRLVWDVRIEEVE